MFSHKYSQTFPAGETFDLFNSDVPNRLSEGFQLLNSKSSIFHPNASIECGLPCHSNSSAQFDTSASERSNHSQVGYPRKKLSGASVHLLEAENFPVLFAEQV